MSIAKIARRTFLIGTAVIAGGVAYGAYRYHADPENPLLADAGEGDAVFNPWVKIGADGITLVTPRADSGQGVYHVQAALIAEELDVELDQITVTPGTPGPAYWNTAIANEAVPATSEGFGAETTRSLMSAMVKFMGLQITGGSTTVPDQFEKLRIAGAVARETLKAAAAAETGYPVNQMETAAGTVTAPNGQSFTYLELAPKAAGMEPVTRIRLRDPSQWRLLGKPMERIDIVAKSTGTQDYGIDYAPEGVKYAAVHMNPGKGGGVIRYDDSAALAMPGVEKVVQITGGVAVVANNTWRAFQAANALDVEWEPAPYPLEQPEHWAALEAAFTEDRLDSRNKDEGDVDTALAEATEVIEAEYRAPYVAHQPLEPITATVQYERRNVQVWTGTQIPRFVQRNVAKLLGEEPEDVHVNVQMMGGSFGHRLEDAVVQQAAEIARELPGVPVKLTYSREEDFAQDFLRQISIARLKGTVKDGKVETMDLSVASPGIIASQMGRQGFPTMGPDMALPAGGADQPFAIPNSRFSVYLADPLAPVSSWRSVGASTNGFFHDSALDELIHAAGADPMEERIRLCWHEGSRGVLEAVAEMCSWSGPSPEPSKGRGVAFTLSFGVPTAEVVEVTNTEEGVRIGKVWVAVEVGRVLDPVNFENLVQGGVIWGLGHAINCEITHTGGAADQLNFHAHEGMRLYQCPEIEVRGLETASKIRGIGEPPTPPAAPALGNAIFAATGMRLREMPFNKGARFI